MTQITAVQVFFTQQNPAFGPGNSSLCGRVLVHHVGSHNRFDEATAQTSSCQQHHGHSAHRVGILVRVRFCGESSQHSTTPTCVGGLAGLWQACGKVLYHTSMNREREKSQLVTYALRLALQPANGIRAAKVPAEGEWSCSSPTCDS